MSVQATAQGARAAEPSTLPAGVRSELAEAVGAEHVLVGVAINPDTFTDESLHGLVQAPAAVVRPGSTAEVAAVVRTAARHRVPVTARGAGTGVSGGCVPSAGGIVLSFERMTAVLDLDLAGHTAVVQPGITLADLNAHLARHGLVYPVFPGTDASSVGGTVATNAGGMRAVRHGVTRSHVLGVEAVTGTGEVLRLGGAVVKRSTGYDLTQLVVGSEGTLALVTEATVRLSPLLGHSATILAPFVDVDEVAAVVPQLIAAGARPSVLEYIDRGTMKGLLRTNDLTLGVSAEVAERTGAYLVVVLEGRSAAEVEAELELVAALLDEAGALDTYILLEGQGDRLLEARENAFWMVKAAGADDLIDLVVPRARIPEYLRAVSAIAEEHGGRVFGCGHAGDGNIHFSVYEPDNERRHALLTAIYQAGLALGGVISGEHGIGAAKKPYFQELVDPALLAVHRQIKAVFDPAGVLNPGKVFDPA
jgi:glycolate oxidase